ncbi:MAG: CarD family transcriptional regulator [Clostridia bacterium]|nr:CarD family transcriptional regulator [Clostridia bacterium]
MYQVGDFVMYGNTGVCRVEEIGHPDAVSDQDTLYYKLSPVYDTEVIYTPVDTKAFMRPVMSKVDAEELIDRIPSIPDNVCDNRDMKMLSEKYRACLNTHENDDLIRLIKSVYMKNQRSIKAGRHMGQTDQQYMKRAEKMLYGELAIALSMEYDQIQPYIKRRVDGQEVKEA